MAIHVRFQQGKKEDPLIIHHEPILIFSVFIFAILLSVLLFHRLHMSSFQTDWHYQVLNYMHLVVTL